MPDRQVVHAMYRGRQITGQWRVKDAALYLESPFGNVTGSAIVIGPSLTTPEEIARAMLIGLARRAEPRRSLLDLFR